MRDIKQSLVDVLELLNSCTPGSSPKPASGTLELWLQIEGMGPFVPRKILNKNVPKPLDFLLGQYGDTDLHSEDKPASTTSETSDIFRIDHHPTIDDCLEPPSLPFSKPHSSNGSAPHAPLAPLVRLRFLTVDHHLEIPLCWCQPKLTHALTTKLVRRLDAPPMTSGSWWHNWSWVRLYN